MLSLFPRFKNRTLFIGGVFIGCIVLLFVLRPGINLLALLAFALIGLLVILASQYMNATNAHNAQLNRLYNQMDVDGFIRDYEPHLKANVRNQNLYLMVRLHLSNAYAAQGRFDDAMALLSSAKVREGKPEQMLIAKFAITSNLCYCAEQKNDIETAKGYLETLRTLKKQLEDIQRTKPKKKQMVFSCELNEQCMKYLTTGKADVQVLKTQVQQNNTQQLHRITTSLWIARADLAENNRKEAESILNQIIKLAPDLYPGRMAKELLASLPAKPDEKDAIAQTASDKTNSKNSKK